MGNYRAATTMLVWLLAPTAAGAVDTHARWQAIGAGGQACLDIMSKIKETNRLIGRSGWILFRPDASDLFWASVELQVLADRAHVAASDLRRIGEASDAERADECATAANDAAKAATAASKALNESSPED